MTNDTPILTASHLHKAFDSRQADRLAAIEDVSFSVRPGEFLTVVGPSGCGKTTLLRLLAGLIPPDAGEVRLHGHPLTEPCAEIGLVFQQANLMPWRSVAGNVHLPLEVAHVPPAQAAERVRAALQTVGLAEFAANFPHELSGGMQQRVAIARALVHRPEILLLDEPFGALDAMTRERLNEELLRLWQSQGKTVVMVTHSIQDAVFLADRVLVLSQRPGRVVTIIPVDLPRPRDMSQVYGGAFGALVALVRQAIR